MKMIPLLAAVALLLAACGTSNVEIQHDGTGTDEMLRSPCACAPVPYDPQFYRWDVG